MKVDTRLRLASMSAALGMAFGRMFDSCPRIVGKNMRPRTWRKPHQGLQEIARRRRQIELGQLTESNGLVKS